MRFISLKLLSFILCIGFFFNTHAEGINFQKLSIAQALKKAKKENKRVFVDVYAEWCGPCKYLSNNVFIDQALGAYMNEHFVSIKINGEQGEGVKMMDEFSIDAYPTLLFLNPDRKLIKKVVGAMEAEDLLEKAKGVIAPESTKLYQLTTRFDKGERDKALLSALLIEKYNEGENLDGIMNEYLRLNPTLNLEDKNDFMVFGLMEKDFNSALVQVFLNEPEKYFELYGELALEQVQSIFGNLVESSKATRDLEAIDKGLDIIYPALQVMAKDLSATKEEIRASIEEYFNN
jgi:thioredoxin-related protein